MPVEPKIAATVILLRERVPNVESNNNCEFEVFMAKRHLNNKFLGGHHVFPGGAIDEQDMTEKSRARIIGLEKHFTDNLKEVCKYPSCLWIIAIRELFEETGILIATKEKGDLIPLERENTNKFRRYQEDLQKNRDSMTNILTKENLYYAANKLQYFGRLVTPEISPIRFDTQFFLCKLPPKQNIHLFSDELVEGSWGSPRYILDLYRLNQIKIIFPQYTSLRRLRKFATIQEAFNKSKNMFRKNWFINF